MSIIHVIDDDEAVRDAIAFLLAGHGLATRQHAAAEDFLALAAAERDGVLVLDIRMPGLSGIELFHALRRTPPLPPVIFLTGHGDVPLAVEAIRAGAFDFMEKPFDETAFMTTVERALSWHADTRLRQERELDIARRRASLSDREAEVMALMLQDRPNKVIAHELGIAMRTVEVHRARVLAKMGARSLVSLAAMLKG